MARLFPMLPQPSTEQGSWSADIFCAHKQIATACANADTLLAQDDCEALRFKILIDKLTNRCLPLLEAMEQMQCDHLPREWIEEAAEGLGQRVVELHGAKVAASER
jgi:hypothetical protein